ncbi:MAG: hypothetical protein ACOYKZ_04940 [Chlamydiia bacterium]
MASESVTQLIDEILKIKGKKILTLSTLDDSFVVDVDASGRFGYQFGVKELFLAKLHRAMRGGGGLVIRQFLELRVKRTTPSLKEMWLPEKNIYIVGLGGNRWVGCSRAEVESCCETDAKTGQPLPKEEGVHYQHFGIAET